jgi:hypothetical protein
MQQQKLQKYFQDSTDQLKKMSGKMWLLTVTAIPGENDLNRFVNPQST